MGVCKRFESSKYLEGGTFSRGEFVHTHDALRRQAHTPESREKGYVRTMYSFTQRVWCKEISDKQTCQILNDHGWLL